MALLVCELYNLDTQLRYLHEFPIDGFNRILTILRGDILLPMTRQSIGDIKGYTISSAEGFESVTPRV
jgi:hypothetical protein